MMSLLGWVFDGDVHWVVHRGYIHDVEVAFFQSFAYKVVLYVDVFPSMINTGILGQF